MTFGFDIAVGISCLFTLIMVFYLSIYWKSQVDSYIRQSKECDSKYPPLEIGLQVKTLWEIYGVEALRNKPDLAAHSSPWHLTPKGQSLIPEKVKEKLDDIPGQPDNREGMASFWLAVKTLGMDNVNQFARESGLTLQEAVGVLGVHVDNLRTQDGQDGRGKP